MFWCSTAIFCRLNLAMLHFCPTFAEIIQATMIHLESDYNNGAHEIVLRHFLETNDERSQSYGDDIYSEHARQLIRAACQTEDAQIYFLAGGTQTNATIIDSVLRPYEGVLCCETAHINVHEAGAVGVCKHYFSC